MSKIRSALDQSKYYLQRNGSTILSVVAIAGVVATSALCIKATVKAVKIIDDVRESKDDKELGKLEIIKEVGAEYIPAAVVGLGTMYSIFGANVLNKKSQEALFGAYLAIGNTYKNYRQKVIELYGPDVDHEVRHQIYMKTAKQNDAILDDIQERCLFLDPISERFFESTEEEVLYAEYHLNRNFALGEDVSMNDFYNFLGIDTTEKGDEVGWSQNMSHEYGYMWIDFNHIPNTTKDGQKYYLIHMPFEPTTDYLD